jgi:hypothetical protein
MLVSRAAHTRHSWGTYFATSRVNRFRSVIQTFGTAANESDAVPRFREDVSKSRCLSVSAFSSQECSTHAVEAPVPAP